MFNLFDDKSATTFNKGSVIVKAGEISSKMYLITRGTAAMFKTGGQATTTLEEGSVFGEASFFLNMPEPATVVALSDVTASTFHCLNALELFKFHPEAAYHITAELCKKVYPYPAAQAPTTAPVQATVAAPTPAPAAKTSPVSKPAPVPKPAVAKASPPPVDKPVPAPAPQAPPPALSGKLFPEGHGTYSLQMANDNKAAVYEQKCTCPICGFAFESLTVIMTRLRREATDIDLRVRYVGIEPMHYDIISCPNCLYSAPNDLFSTASGKCVDDLNREIGAYRSDLIIMPGRARDTLTVFAGYYLAIKCGPLCFDGHELTSAGLWQKLSRLYSDCGDTNMYLYASKEAIKMYEHVFFHYNISEKQLQQINYILGDLYERIEDYTSARKYFFNVKSSAEGTNAMKQQADTRLLAIKAKTNNA